MSRSLEKLPKKPSQLLIWPLVFFVVLVISMVILVPTVAAGGYGDTDALEHKVTTADKTGLNLLLTQLYNDHRLIYSLVVTLTMAFLGMVVALATELLLKLLGARKLGGIH
jgi:ABC-type phosphate/phosphonate transport system permease subunit